MNIMELQEQRYYIVLEALLMGFPIKFNSNWDLVLHEGTIYEIFFSKKNGEEVTRKSKLALQDFLDNFGSISDHDLKQIFGNIKLHKFQQKLLAKA